jgi:ribonucleotide reductase alpha subunit
MRVANTTNHGTNSTKLQSPVRLSSNAPTKPARTLGMRRSHNHLRPKTPANWPRVRQTAMGYAESSAAALVALAVTGSTSSINNGNVISPPPLASALIAPATTLATNNKR